MSLGIAFKGAEGIVLAADSRVTLPHWMDVPGVAGQPPQRILIPATFDNATKLLHVECQKHVGAVTFGAGAIGGTAPRTALSFMPEFEDELKKSERGHISVQQFARKLGEFFLAQWTAAKMPNPVPAHDQMIFLVGGYDEKATHGRVFQVEVPNSPAPVEFAPDAFGATWGGQRQYVDRLMGFDPSISQHVYDILKIPAAEREPREFEDELRKKLALPIPWQFLPLQDCIDFCIFFIRTTIEFQRLLVTLRGVGGEIDIATVTRTKGFETIQMKELQGDGFFPLDRR